MSGWAGGSGWVGGWVVQGGQRFSVVQGGSEGGFQGGFQGGSGVRPDKNEPNAMWGSILTVSPKKCSEQLKNDVWTKNEVKKKVFLKKGGQKWGKKWSSGAQLTSTKGCLLPLSRGWFFVLVNETTDFVSNGSLQSPRTLVV